MADLDGFRGSFSSAEYSTGDLIEPPDVEFLHSCGSSLDSRTQRRISDRLIKYALSNNYLILGSSEMNGVGWQVYRLNAFSPVKHAQPVKQPIAGARGAPAKPAKGRNRPATGLGHAHSRGNGNAGVSLAVHASQQKNSIRSNDAARRGLRTRRPMCVSTCTLRSSVRTHLRRHLKYVRHRTLLTSYLHTSTQTDNICTCQLQCLLLRAESWDFNVFHLDQYSLGRPLVHLALHLFNKYELIKEFRLDYRALIATFKTIEDSYHPNIAYHNSVHAADVAQAVDCLMRDTALFHHLSHFDKMMLLLSAFAHDVDHPGVNAPFLLKTNHFLSKLSAHSSSILENHHWRVTAAILSATGLFKHFSSELYTRSIDRLKHLILATDIVRHQDFITQMTEYIDDQRRLPSLTSAVGPSEADKDFLMQYIIKLADICNPTRTWELCQHWSSRICTEFFQQSDVERQLGLPVTPRFDRFTTTVADTQIGFIDYLVRHSFVLWNRMAASKMSEKLLDNLESNRRTWEFAKLKQQKALTEENEARMRREAEKENCFRQARPAVEIHVVGDDSDEDDTPRKKEASESYMHDGDDAQHSPAKALRKATCDETEEIHDETLAKYLHDRRHSAPNDACNLCLAGARGSRLEVTNGVSEQRRRSMPHVLVWSRTNGVGKRQLEQPSALDTKCLAKVDCTQMPSDHDLATKRNDSPRRTDDQIVPVITIDEVLCSTVPIIDNCRCQTTECPAQRPATRLSSDPMFGPKHILRNKMSLQFPALAAKKPSIIEGPVNLLELLRHRRFSFPPSNPELLRIDASHTMLANYNDSRGARNDRAKRHAANIRRVRTIAKGDTLKYENSALGNATNIIAITRDGEKDDGKRSYATEKRVRPVTVNLKRKISKKLLHVVEDDSDNDELDDDDDDEDEGDRLCLPAVQRHRSHSIEFDSARFVGGTMQYLASIGYDVIVAAVNSPSGSPSS